MSKTLALYKQDAKIIPIKPPKPWMKYVNRLADEITGHVENYAYVLLNEMAEAGDQKAAKILTQAWKQLAEEKDEDDEEEGAEYDDE